MRSIQEIFNTVINAGYYGEREGRRSSSFMCIALRVASSRRTIGADEYKFAAAEIKGYLGQLRNRTNPLPFPENLRAPLAASSLPSLRALLGALNLPSSDEDCLAIYKDWESRPFVSHYPSFLGDVDYTEVYREELDALGDFDTWLQEQYTANGDQCANLSQHGFFCIHPKEGSRVVARFRVMRKVTRGNRRGVSGMARVAYTQGGQRGSAYVPNIEVWAESARLYLNSPDPFKKITEWDYEI